MLCVILKLQVIRLFSSFFSILFYSSRLFYCISSFLLSPIIISLFYFFFLQINFYFICIISFIVEFLSFPLTSLFSISYFSFHTVIFPFIFISLILFFFHSSSSFFHFIIFYLLSIFISIFLTFYYFLLSFLPFIFFFLLFIFFPNSVTTIPFRDIECDTSSHYSSSNLCVITSASNHRSFHPSHTR